MAAAGKPSEPKLNVQVAVCPAPAALVCLQLANHETGTLQDLAPLVALAHGAAEVRLEHFLNALTRIDAAAVEVVDVGRDLRDGEGGVEGEARQGGYRRAGHQVMMIL